MSLNSTYFDFNWSYVCPFNVLPSNPYLFSKSSRNSFAFLVFSACFAFGSRWYFVGGGIGFGRFFMTVVVVLSPSFSSSSLSSSSSSSSSSSCSSSSLSLPASTNKRGSNTFPFQLSTISSISRFGLNATSPVPSQSFSSVTGPLHLGQFRFLSS